MSVSINFYCNTPTFTHTWPGAPPANSKWSHCKGLHGLPETRRKGVKHILPDPCRKSLLSPNPGKNEKKKGQVQKNLELKVRSFAATRPQSTECVVVCEKTS